MKYRKKPIIIEAMQFPDSGPEQGDVSRWIEANAGKLNLYDGQIESHITTSTQATWRWSCASIDTLEGSMIVNIGDWIIKGIKGEFYPCKPDIFEATYEAAEEE
jgi:hypothetical protein